MTTRRSGVARRLWLAGVLAAVTLPSTALAESFAVMTYNVRGLPPEVIENRSTQMSKIAPLLQDFHTPAPPYEGIASVVGLQELFYQPYYDTLTNPQVVTYPHKTAKDTGGPNSIGDGLTILSDFSFDNFLRTKWDDCFGNLGQFGSDCDTNKGFTYTRVELTEAITFDLYTLHADAGQDEGSRAARRSNITELTQAINNNSPEGQAVIVIGDTNSLYTRQGSDGDNIQDLLFGADLTDVWVQLRRSGVVPTSGDEIDGDCDTTPDSADCELVDKIFYRDGGTLVFVPTSYSVLKTMFSDGGVDLSDHYPVAVTFDWAIVTTTTTTTSTSSTSTSTSTSTTLAGPRPCGDPVALVARRERRRAAAEGGQSVVAAIGSSDALFVLKRAVGLVQCDLCVCDVNNSGAVTAGDALTVLKAAVGQTVTISCPPCA